MSILARAVNRPQRSRYLFEESYLSHKFKTQNLPKSMLYVDSFRHGLAAYKQAVNCLSPVKPKSMGWEVLQR